MANRIIGICKLLLLCGFLAACAEYQLYEPAPIDIEETTRIYREIDLDSEPLKTLLGSSGHDVSDWPKHQWDLEELVTVAEYYHSELAISKVKLKLAKAKEVSAGQKNNPQLAFSTEHHSDHTEGKSPWSFGTIFSWVYERPEKRQTRIDHATAITEVARLEQFEILWTIRDDVTDNYLDTISAINQQTMLLEEKSVLEQGIDLLQRRIEFGQASEFEISSLRLERQRLTLSLSELEADEVRARSRLALATGLPADALQATDLKQDYFHKLPILSSADLELGLLQTRALIERPDLLRSLSTYVVAEADLHLQIEKQYPDITLSPGFIFDQGDNVWAMASAWVLPIKAKNTGGIAEAEARRMLKAQQFLAFQKRVLSQVHYARISYQAALKTLAEADLLINDLDVRNQKLQRQFDLGYTDRLALIRSQLETLTVRRSRYLLKLTAWREFESLEDALMSRLIK